MVSIENTLFSDRGNGLITTFHLLNVYIASFFMIISYIIIFAFNINDLKKYKLFNNHDKKYG